MMRKAIVEIHFDSIREAEIIFKSIYPETKKKIPNTSVHAEISDNKILLEIDSKNTSSLRAACNSFLRWVETAKSVVETLSEP